MKGNIVNFRQGMYCEKSLSRFWEIYHLIEYHISIWPNFALSTVFFYLCFYERQADKPARPIGWLGFMWKEILSTLPRESIMKKFRAVLEKIWHLRYHVLEAFAKMSPDSPDLFSMFLWMPGWQTSAANWMTRFMCKEILFTLRRESIMKKFRAVLEKCNI